MSDPRDATERIERTKARIVDDGAVLAVRLGTGAPVLDACRAAIRGGLPVLELTLTTPGALEAMETLARADEGFVGGGTVLTPDDVRRVCDAGGHFVFSPVFDPDVVDEATARGLLAVPGTATPAEALAAHRHGARLVKVFPSGALGGPAFIRALRAPLPGIDLIATSGPTAETIAEYLEAGVLAVGVGAEVFPPGFTMESVEAAAGRVRRALDAARGRA
jgi:2-dehydro-3-deoxyphosphogluconate aldolase/(4S)-4-hydroxy-2-oxoglutarate aldolase